MLTVTSKCYLHIIFISTVVSKFTKKAHELEINKKKSRKIWELEGTQGTKHMSHETRTAREHVGHVI